MSVLLVDFVKYVLSVPKEEEKEFHPIVKKCSKQIFGEDSIYFDVKHTIKTVSGIGSIPDAYVINLATDEWYVVENELSSHPIYDHIVKQLTNFINGIENPAARNEITDILYSEINRDVELRAKIQKKIGFKDIHHFLSKLISKDPRIVIVIDQKTREIEEACRALKYQPDIIELKTYVREDAPAVHAYLIEPLCTFKKTEAEEEKRRTIPEHYKSWDKMLQWVNDNVREMVALLTDRITQLGNVNHAAHGKHYCFYRGKPSTRSIFAAFILTKF